MIDALHSEGRLRVWSLVITVFGDMVQHRGGVVSTARLTALLSRIGVERGALRTALSRLGRDGWVDSERAGRTSLYRLSPQGVARFEPATSLIYAPPRQEPVTRWSVVLDVAEGGPRVSLVPAGQVPEGADLVVSGTLDHVSQAYLAQVTGPELRRAIDALAQDLAHLEDADLRDPLEAAAARVLLVHRWRRLVLRHPEPLPDLLPKDVALRAPRAAVAQAYARLTPLAEAWLDTALPDAPALPVADAQFAQRFIAAERA